MLRLGECSLLLVRRRARESGPRFITFSNWMRPGKEPVDFIDRLKAMCREVRKGEMPLASYKLIHWHAWLSAADADRICAWSDAEQKQISAMPQ
ncbi:MAG: heme-binding domain-containing protein [Acidobacteriaceae bacterium]